MSGRRKLDYSKPKRCSVAYGSYNRASACYGPQSPTLHCTAISITASGTCSASTLCCAASTSRNTPPQRVQRVLRQRGRCPLQQICFKSTSTSCEAKCASFCWTHRLVSKTSADPPVSPPQAKLTCVSEGKRRGLDTVDLHAGCWKQRAEREMKPSPREGSPLSGEDSPSWALDGREMIAPWNVDLKYGHGEAHTLGGTAPNAGLLARSCTLCVLVCECCKFLSVRSVHFQ